LVDFGAEAHVFLTETVVFQLEGAAFFAKSLLVGLH
jgi:hypothetical protein